MVGQSKYSTADPYAAACACQACWCLKPAVDGEPCEDCAAGRHQPAANVAAANPAAVPKRHRHRWDPRTNPIVCITCGHPQDPVLSARGRNNRRRGQRHELAASRRYGGENIGALKQASDLRQGMFKVQIKTHQGRPPSQLMALFAALDATADGRTPVVLHRYLQPGKRAVDLFVIRGDDWVALHGVE